LLAEIAFDEGGDPVGAATGDPESALRDLLQRLSGARRSAAPTAASQSAATKPKSSRSSAPKTKTTAPGARSRAVVPSRRAAPRSRSVPASRGRG
jgi:hypothetical protein